MAAIWPFRQFGFKVVSVVLAVLIWLLVAGAQTVERGLRVPLQLQQFPSGFELVGDAPTQVDVRVRGSSVTVGRLVPGDLVAIVDVRTASAGQRLYQLTPEQVQAPFGVEVVQVMPATIALVFEPSETGVVSVVPVIEGRPAPGFLVGRWTIDPATVEVVGPASAVAQADDALTETISVEGATETVTAIVTIGFVDPTLRMKTARRASVEIEVLPGLERVFSRRPVRLQNLAANLSAQSVPSAVDVVLRGRREEIGVVRPDDVGAFVDLSGLGPGEYALTAYGDPPADSGVSQVDPQTVKITITRGRN